MRIMWLSNKIWRLRISCSIVTCTIFLEKNQMKTRINRLKIISYQFHHLIMKRTGIRLLRISSSFIVLRMETQTLGVEKTKLTMEKMTRTTCHQGATFTCNNNTMTRIMRTTMII